MSRIEAYNRVYVILLSALLFLSFTPTESGESSLSLYLRIFPFTIFLLIFFIKNNRAKISYQGLVFSLLFCVIIGAIKANDASLRLSFQLLTVMLTYVFSSIVNKNSTEHANFLTILSLVISFWVGSLIVQIVTFQISGIILDFHNILFPFSESRGFVGTSLKRFGGVQIEPGTYSNWLFGAVVLRIFLIERISSPLHWIAIISTLLTFSFWAYLSFICFFVAVFFEKKRMGKIFSIFLVVLLGLIFFYIFGDEIFTYLQKRSDLNTVTATGKLDVYNYLLNNVSEWVLLGGSLTSTPCYGCASPQDAGVGVNSIYYFGLLILFPFFLLMVKSFRFFGFKGVVLLLPLFFAKYSFWDPITILLITFIIVFKHSSEKKDNSVI